MTGIRALLLDIDDTLLDTRGAMRRAAATCLAEVWPVLADGVGERARELGVRYHGDPGGFFAAYTRGEMSFRQMREARLREVVDHAGLSWHAGVFEGFEERWPEAFRSETVVFEDVRALLDRAAADGLVVGALTNSSQQFTELKLEAAGLEGAFAAVATTDTLGFGKPDPRAFHEACRLLGSRPEETVYVGDDRVVDAEAAVRAGLRGVWLDRRGEVADAASGAVDIAVVTTLDDVSWR